MVDKRLAITLAAAVAALLFTPATAEIGAGVNNDDKAAEASYLEYVAAIHKAQHVNQLPSFTHSSPLNRLKLVDSAEEEKEALSTLKEMTPHTVKEEGIVHFGNGIYIFYAGDPELSTRQKEYFPVIAEMVKEDGRWKLRRQQSAHVKDGSPLALVIPKGEPRVKRFEELLGALTHPVPAQMASGTIAGKTFRAREVYFFHREGYFRLSFMDGDTCFSVYVRDPSSFAEVQNQHFAVMPMDGMECDLTPPQIVLAPYCAKIHFGKVVKDQLPGTISLAVRTPLAVNLQGTFFAKQGDDALTPDEEDKQSK